MVEVFENWSLKPYNTFGIECNAKYFANYHQPSDIIELISSGQLNHTIPFIILGGGSNQLFIRDFDGLVLHPVNAFITILNETPTHVFVSVGAGTNWDNLVAWAVENGFGGIENLSDIPGNVGAAPVQNIGAYGMEAKDTIFEVRVVSLADGSTKILKAQECQFGYRTSIFKHRFKDQYLIDQVTFKLQKNPTFVTHYGSLQQALDSSGETTLKNIREVIIKTRNEKLPDPKLTGNAGSFFKNPIVPLHHAKNLLRVYPDMVTYPVDDYNIKIAAGWLIEHCGLKGYINAKGTAGVHQKQALVLVNLGGATGSEVLEVSQFVQNKVFNTYQIQLEPEVIMV